VIREINVRDKGQITLPADIRHELGLDHGGKLMLVKRGNEYVLVRPQDLKDTAAGALAKYAKIRNPDPAEERRWVAEHIAKTADNDE
jgi:AbrB family looped-hinge helix DNA binding protein